MRRAMSVLLTLLTVLTVAGLAVFLYARFLEPRLLVTETVTIVSPNVSEAAEGLRIVQFSDVHVNDDDHRSKLADLTAAVNAQEPDLLVFTGDLFDAFQNFEGDTQKVADALNAMKAKYGKYAVLGNHDYGKDAAEATVRLLQDAGFTVLRGERAVLKELGITITGFDDAIYARDPAETKLDGAEGFHLVLAHEPDIAETLDASLYDLMLSGHTHGGQVNLPGVEAIYLPKLGQKYKHGLYRPGGAGTRGQLYVNRGIGESLMPVRLGSMPEVTALTLIKG